MHTFGSQHAYTVTHVHRIHVPLVHGYTRSSFEGHRRPGGRYQQSIGELHHMSNSYYLVLSTLLPLARLLLALHSTSSGSMCLYIM